MSKYPSCFFCVNSAKTVQKLKITEDCGDGNTIRYDLTYFFGHQIEPYLRDDDYLCNNCMNFFKNMTYIKKRLLDIMYHRDEEPEIKAQDFNDVWNTFTDFAANLTKFNPNNTNEAWDLDIANRCATPDPLSLKCEEFIRRKHRRKSRKTDDEAVDDLPNNEDEEVKRFLKIRKLEYDWSVSQGMRRSTRLLKYNGDFRSNSTNGRRSVTTKRSISTQPVRKRERARGTRSVCHDTVRQHKPIIKDQPEKYNCDLCKYPFTLLDNFTTHMVEEHKLDALYDCGECSKAYLVKEHLKKHTAEHEREILTCFECRAKIKGIHNLQQHLRKHLLCSYVCEYCHLSFLTFEEHSDHYKAQHHGKKQTKLEEERSTVLESLVNEEKIKLKQLDNITSREESKCFKSIVMAKMAPPPEIILTPASPITIIEEDNTFDFWAITGIRMRTDLIRAPQFFDPGEARPPMKKSNVLREDPPETRPANSEVIEEIVAETRPEISEVNEEIMAETLPAISEVDEEIMVDTRPPISEVNEEIVTEEDNGSLDEETISQLPILPEIDNHLLDEVIGNSTPVKTHDSPLCDDCSVVEEVEMLPDVSHADMKTYEEVRYRSGPYVLLTRYNMERYLKK